MEINIPEPPSITYWWNPLMEVPVRYQVKIMYVFIQWVIERGSRVLFSIPQPLAVNSDKKTRTSRPKVIILFFNFLNMSSSQVTITLDLGFEETRPNGLLSLS